MSDAHHTQAQYSDAHWMPFSANRNFKQDPRFVVAAEGNYLIDDQGRRIYDSLSGYGHVVLGIPVARFKML